MASIFDTLSAGARRRGRVERAALVELSCGPCLHGCGHVSGRGDGCEHYACFAALADVADTCPEAVVAIKAALDGDTTGEKR